MASCINELVTHKETEGDLCSFSAAKTLGKVPFCAAAKGISAVIIVHASQLARTAINNPIFISQLPHFPTTASKTPAVDGLGTAASSA